MSLQAFLVSQSAPPPTTAGAGTLGLFILLSMGAATALLIMNMNGRLKRLPRSYDDPTSLSETDPTAGSAGAEVRGARD